MDLDTEKIERFAHGMEFVDHMGHTCAEIDITESGPTRVVIALNFGWDGAEFWLDRIGGSGTPWVLTVLAPGHADTSPSTTIQAVRNRQDLYAISAFMKVEWALRALVAALAP